MSTKPYWMLSRPQRKLYRLPLTVAALYEVCGTEQWSGKRDRHIEFEETLEREGLKRPGSRRDGTGSGGRTHAALVRSLGFAFNSKETGELELTLAGIELANGVRPMDILSHQVMRFQYPSTYSLSRRVNIDPKFKLRPFVLLFRLLLRADLAHSLSEDEIALIVITEGTGDSNADSDRIAQLIKNYRADGIDESSFVARFGKAGDTFESIKSRFGDIANTAMNWLEVTSAVERASGKIELAVASIPFAESLVNQYGNVPLIAHPQDEDRFQRSYGLPPGKRKDTRNLSSTTYVTRDEFVFRKVNTLLTGWSQTELLIDGATPELVDRIVSSTQFTHAEAEKAASRVLGSDRTLDSFLVHYQGLVYSLSKDAARMFEQTTALLLSQVFHLETKCVGQTGREPDVLVKQPGDWRGIIDTKAYSGDYSLPAGHQRAMREYVEQHKSSEPEYLRFWAFIAGSVSAGASQRAKSLANLVDVPGTVVGMLAWLRIIRLGYSGQMSPEDLANLLSSSGEITVAHITR